MCKICVTNNLANYLFCSQNIPSWQGLYSPLPAGEESDLKYLAHQGQPHIPPDASLTRVCPSWLLCEVESEKYM